MNRQDATRLLDAYTMAAQTIKDSHIVDNLREVIISEMTDTTYYPIVSTTTPKTRPCSPLVTWNGDYTSGTVHVSNEGTVHVNDEVVSNGN